MNFMDIIHRNPVPEPYSEGEKIPWNDPDFSQRMLLEHLSQQHDAASRRFENIEKHVAWIQRTILSDKPTKILDLGCGPGLYTNRLAKLGHECTGIDFSPASINYAVESARRDNLSCSYIQQDIRAADYGQGYGLAMLIFGEFNVFRLTDARLILKKAFQALAENGHLLLEVHTFAAVTTIGKQPSSWYSSESGLFSARPHICLTEHFWDDEHNIATTRHLILDGQIDKVAWYAETMQAYTPDQYQLLLEECGFEKITSYPSLDGDVDRSQRALMVIACQKKKTA
jgi:SAM-dependent methyltransferase